VAAVAAAGAGKPVVVVVMSGSPVDVSPQVKDANVGALMWCGYPGQSGGTAIAEALFGQTNSFGKLTMTWYPESLCKEVPALSTDLGGGRPPLSGYVTLFVLLFLTVLLLVLHRPSATRNWLLLLTPLRCCSQGACLRHGHAPERGHR
jgi:hypothetical protein